MAQIVINEISQNYSYNIGTNSFATVALPITSCWGPGFFDPKSAGMDTEEMLEYTAWERFPATQNGLESFVSTYRGPAANYRLAQDYSYQMAMTLLTAGYDVLVCRMSPGTYAEGQIKCGDAILHIKAKYPGTFANMLRVEIKKFSYKARENGVYVKKWYWSVITSIIDDSGIKTSVENLTLVFDINDATDSMLYYDEIDSRFITLSVEGKIKDDENAEFVPIFADGTEIPVDKRLSSLPYTDLEGGSDRAANPVVDNENVKTNVLAALEEGTLKTILSNVTDDKLAEIISAGNAVVANKANTTEYATKLAELVSIINEAKGVGDPDITSEDAERLVAVLPSAEDKDMYDQLLDDALELAEIRYATVNDKTEHLYTSAIASLKDVEPDVTKAVNIRYMEWLYTYAVGTKAKDGSYTGVYDLLKDKLTYNPNRVISPGWDDQNVLFITDDDQPVKLTEESPLILKIMDIAYYSRCATGMIDIPRSLARGYVYNEELEDEKQGYVQRLARYIPDDTSGDVNGSLYQTHSAVFAPWGKYTYVGTSKQSPASPSFLTLMIQRAQILNQANQFEWVLPTNRKHNLRIGRMDYNVPKKYLDVWQRTEGVGVNVITSIPDLGTNIWGNSTLFEVPPATYQALGNLSTRYLVNAVEDVIYRVGIGITFNYNNDQAYNKFYAGVTPILDTMKNSGAIDDYYVKMSADINGLDHVNANSVIGKVYLVVNGVINDIICDLIALPPGTDLNQFKA